MEQVQVQVLSDESNSCTCSSRSNDDVQAAATLAAATFWPALPCLDDAATSEEECQPAEPEQTAAAKVCFVENETLQQAGDIGLDYTYFDVSDALLEFGFTLPPPPPPSYCGSPWDDAADDLFFGEPLVLWEH
ncbi:hypothetical protein ABZP36_002871 [Zizania latifolia]